MCSIFGYLFKLFFHRIHVFSWNFTFSRIRGISFLHFFKTHYNISIVGFAYLLLNSFICSWWRTTYNWSVSSNWFWNWVTLNASETSKILLILTSSKLRWSNWICLSRYFFNKNDFLFVTSSTLLLRLFISLLANFAPPFSSFNSTYRNTTAHVFKGWNSHFAFFFEFFVHLLSCTRY